MKKKHFISTKRFSLSKKLTLPLVFVLLFTFSSFAQKPPTQNIRGRIVENGSLAPIPFATVVVFTESSFLSLRKMSKDRSSDAQGIVDSLYTQWVEKETNQQIWTGISDIDGNFKISDVMIGNIVVWIRSMGYESFITPILSLVPGKEMVLQPELSIDITELEVVTISDRRDAYTVSEMVTNSARIFSLDEANRYAGSFGDISRMAQNYAGVSSANDGVNDIVIRGNSPSGLLWRIDDIDIFNPNHFSDGGAKGGVVSMINPNILRNSDFYTGAFPASFSNALSGVFDLKIRNGNTDKHEFTGQVGYTGFELGAEGPLSRKNKSSYIVNARYSVMDIADKIAGSPNGASSVPKYGDISARFNLPTQKAGVFSLFLLGGINAIQFDEGEGQQYFSEPGKLYNHGSLGIVNLSHMYPFSKSTYYKASLSYQYSRSGSHIHSVDSLTEEEELYWKSLFERQRVAASAYVSSNLRKNINLKAGLSFRQDFYDFATFEVHDYGREYYLLEKGNGGFGSLYAELSYRPLKNLKILPGISYSMYLGNHTASLDPRLGVVYEVGTQHELSLAYGHVSQMQEQWLYATNDQGNSHLKMSKAHHFVLGWQWAFAPSFRFKTEVYYQSLYQLPVSVAPSSFCFVNEGTFASQGFYQYNIPMNNGGKGQNKGIELTLEKSLSKGWYALVTASFFDSKYQASNGNSYSTAFDLGHVLNVLGGKEFRLNANNALFFDTRISWTGGPRYTPALLSADGNLIFDDFGDPMLDESQAFALRMNDYFRWDFKIGYRLNIRRTTHEFAFECQNISARQNEYSLSYNAVSGQMEINHQVGFYPMAFYRIYF